MTLEQQLAASRAESPRTAPPDRVALYEAKIEELRGSFAREAAVGVGASAPDVRLPDADGAPVELGALLRQGPFVFTF